MKQTWLAVFAVLLIAVSASASQLPDFPFVIVDGEAEVEVPPDMATVSFTVEVYDTEAAKAREGVQSISAELIDFFASLRIPKADIVAYKFEKSPVYQTKKYQQLNILGYKIKRRFQITLTDIHQYDAFARKLISMNHVLGVTADFDRSDREKIEAELVGKAGLDAKAQAERMAAGFGVPLGQVFAISMQGFRNIGAKFGLAPGSGYPRTALHRSPSKEEALFIPSTIILKGSVTAIYRLPIK